MLPLASRRSLAGYEVLAGALGEHDDGTAALGDPAFEQRQQSVVAVEREADLGDQHEVGVVVGEGGVAGDEPGVAAHDLDDADAADGRLDLDAGGLDRLGGLGERRGEAEALADVRDVVVDRLGHADDADRQAPRARSRREMLWAPRIEPSPPMTMRMSMSSSTSRSTIAAGSWAPRDVPSTVPPRSLMRATDSGVSVHDVVAELGDQAGVAVLEADHVAYAVVGVELEHDRADDVVEAGAQSAAGDDADLGGGRVEEDLLSRAARLERRQVLERHAA